MVRSISKPDQVMEDPFKNSIKIYHQKDNLKFPLKVMKSRLVEALPTGEFLYQVKWDGMRWISSARGFTSFSVFTAQDKQPLPQAS